jgi:uncharacterized membrane protein
MRRTERNTYSQSSYQAYGRPQEPPYEEDPQETYDEEPYEEEQPYEDEKPYAEEQPYGEPPYGQEQQEPEVISTSQAINLTCTLAAFSGVFAFFLYVADRRSEAVRRISVQSIALTGGFLSVSVVLLIVGTLFRIIPFLGIVIAVIFWLLFAVLLLATIYLKVQMALHAYRGLAYQLPLIGGYVRRFE